MTGLLGRKLIRSLYLVVSSFSGFDWFPGEDIDLVRDSERHLTGFTLLAQFVLPKVAHVGYRENPVGFTGKTLTF